MAELLILAFAGVVGSFMRAWVTKRQDTFSRETAGECFIGLLTGLLYPVVIGPLLATVVDLPQSNDPAVAITLKAALLAATAYIAGDVIQNLIPGLVARFAGRPVK